nr:2-hydroxyacyl-CoA dehydratase [Peptoniphilus harei]
MTLILQSKIHTWHLLTNSQEWTKIQFFTTQTFGRDQNVVDLAVDNDADGCLLFMMTFNDTEEMEYPSLKQAYEKAGIPLIKLGYDQQMTDFGQAKTQLETFNEMVQLNRM